MGNPQKDDKWFYCLHFSRWGYNNAITFKFSVNLLDRCFPTICCPRASFRCWLFHNNQHRRLHSLGQPVCSTVADLQWQTMAFDRFCIHSGYSVFVVRKCEGIWCVGQEDQKAQCRGNVLIFPLIFTFLDIDFFCRARALKFDLLLLYQSDTLSHIIPGWNGCFIG